MSADRPFHCRIRPIKIQARHGFSPAASNQPVDVFMLSQMKHSPFNSIVVRSCCHKCWISPLSLSLSLSLPLPFAVPNVASLSTGCVARTGILAASQSRKGPLLSHFFGRNGPLGGLVAQFRIMGSRKRGPFAWFRHPCWGPKKKWKFEKYKNQKKKQWIDPKYMLFDTWLYEILILAQGSTHIAKKCVSFFKQWAPSFLHCVLYHLRHVENVGECRLAKEPNHTFFWIIAVVNLIRR